MKDIRFMCGYGLGIYWKLTWSFIVPIGLLVIFVYAMVVYEPLNTDNEKPYPAEATGECCIIHWSTSGLILFWTISRRLGTSGHCGSADSCVGLMGSLQAGQLLVDSGLMRVYCKFWSHVQIICIFLQKLQISLLPASEWGPADPALKREWIDFQRTSLPLRWLPVIFRRSTETPGTIHFFLISSSSVTLFIYYNSGRNNVCYHGR